MKVTPASVARSLFGGVDTSFRPLAEKAALLFSLLVIVSGIVANGTRWTALGLAVGVPGVVLPYVVRRLQWSAARLWVLLAIIVVLDLGVLSAIASTPGT